MGGWILAAAAAAFWLGILVAGLPSGGLGHAAGWGMSASGAAGLAVAALTQPRTGGSAVRRTLVVGLSIGAFGLLGAGWSAVREARVRHSILGSLRARVVRVSGSLGSDPKEGFTGWTATLNADAVAWMEWDDAGQGPSLVSRRARDAVWIEGRGPAPGLRTGDRVVLEGLLSPPEGAFGGYLRHRGYAATFAIRGVVARAPPGSVVVRAADALRAALLRSLDRVLPRREAGLVAGLALGDTSQQDGQVEEDFRATGLSHLTAVSGENVAMFLAPVVGLAMLLRIGRRARFAVGVTATAFFVVLTRAEPSVLRAAAMAGLTMLGVFLGRPRSPPAIMGGAVLVLLGVNPTLVYAIGFQLSVAATAGMALLAEPVSRRLRFLPRGLALAAGTTIGAQAGVTPLLLYHFGVVPTVSVPANLLAFPAVSPGMLLGLAAAAAGLVWAPSGVILAAAARIPLQYLVGLADRMARSPLPSITSSGGGLLTLVVGFVAVLAGAWWLRASRRASRRSLAAGALILPFFLWAGALRAGPPAVLTVTFFDVGQGDAALIRSPGGAAILIDGGPDPQAVATKLAGLGVRRLDLLVATHPHADHVGGLTAVLARFPVALAIDPGCRGDSPFYLSFLSAVHAAGVHFAHPSVGTVLAVGDVRVEVLGPEHCFTGTNSDPNNDSMVLRVVDGDASVLFPGDAEQPSQSDLLRDEAPFLSAVVLKVPHHGGATSLDALFRAVHARMAVVSVGPNRYGHPVPAVLEELSHDGMQVYRTDRYGDITVSFRREGLLIQSSRG